MLQPLQDLLFYFNSIRMHILCSGKYYYQNLNAYIAYFNFQRNRKIAEN